MFAFIFLNTSGYENAHVVAETLMLAFWTKLMNEWIQKEKKNQFYFYENLE
jgi:hypothetical protein